MEQLNAIRQSLAPYLSASALDEASGYDLRSMHSSLRRWESAVETGIEEIVLLFMERLCTV